MEILYKKEDIEYYYDYDDINFNMKLIKKHDDIYQIIGEYINIRDYLSNFFADNSPILYLLPNHGSEWKYYDLRNENEIEINNINDITLLLKSLNDEIEVKKNIKFIYLNNLHYMFNENNELITDEGIKTYNKEYSKIVELRCVDDSFKYYDLELKKFIDLDINYFIENSHELDINSIYYKKYDCKVFRFENKYSISKLNKQYLVNKYDRISERLNNRYLLLHKYDENISIFDLIEEKIIVPNILLDYTEQEYLLNNLYKYELNIEKYLIFPISRKCIILLDEDFQIINKIYFNESKYSFLDKNGNILQDFSNYNNLQQLISDYIEYLNLMQNINLIKNEPR